MVNKHEAFVKLIRYVSTWVFEQESSMMGHSQHLSLLCIKQKEDFDVLIVGGEDTSTGMKPTNFHDPYGNLEK
jgi:hypothetical protein